ncbi:MAG: acylphosphatase [Syntrophaceae bacterium]|nr:acylphosphatase [Syntrophaceae bacterium]
MVRKRVYYSGRVQGVGFRYTAVRISQNHKVSGYVRNMMDGRVEMVAQGAEAEVERFLDELAEVMGSCIREVRVQDEECAEKLVGFDIRF